MSDREHPPAAAADAEPVEPKPAETVAAPAPPPAIPGEAPGWRTVTIGLAAALLLVFGLVATAPLWAPLLPWGVGADRETERAIAARLGRLEAAQAQAVQLQQQQTQLRQQLQQVQQDANTSMQRLMQRIEALEARPAPPDTAAIAELRQQLAKVSQSASELAARVEAVEKSAQDQTARDTADAAMVMGLLQIRDAVQAGKPFAAEYEAFAAMARRRPEIAEAAAPLAEPATTGVASPAVLAKRLRELAASIAGAAAPTTVPSDPAASGWGEAALARLRGLVTIRRIDGARPEGADAAVNAAERALAGGDLAAAVAALDKLTGAPAEAAAPWLRMARQRLAVDAALRRLEALVTARLGGPTPPGSSG